jgi:hypothetical protein
MSTRLSQLGLAAAATAVALTGAGAVLPATAADTGARLHGAWKMRGTITRADGVRGERRGQRITRKWSFASTCGSGACQTATLTRLRTHGQTDVTTLRRLAANSYAGSGRFYVRLRCAGRVYPRGGVATMSISVQVTRSATVQGKQFATRISAVYKNPRRVNRTPCPGGIGRDAATYTGSLTSPVPSPPTADFTSSTDAVTMSSSFTDASRAGASGAKLVKWRWNFGDPASGKDNTSTERNPTHHYSAPGPHTVTLTVTDADGLTGTVQHEVTA